MQQRRRGVKEEIDNPKPDAESEKGCQVNAMYFASAMALQSRDVYSELVGITVGECTCATGHRRYRSRPMRTNQRVSSHDVERAVVRAARGNPEMNILRRWESRST
jgi:hypothetical protein